MSENENAANLMWQLEQELGVKGPANVLRAALKIAKEAAAQSKDVEPPAPPAWMVEVAREANAKFHDTRGNRDVADAYRSGHCDGDHGSLLVLAALRLALERRHVVVPREWTEEELLKAAREDAARVAEKDNLPGTAERIRAGEMDAWNVVKAALQARRNMLKEGAVAAPAAPSVDLEAALKRAWEAGWNSTRAALCEMYYGKDATNALYEGMKGDDVAAILASLPTREA